MKLAILQCADTGPLESLVVMLRAVGYDCVLPDSNLRSLLRSIGCDTVLDIEGLVRGWGYDPPFPIRSVGPEAMDSADLYVDVKGHRNGPHVWRHWPRLRDRTLWYRINGGRPEHVIRRNDTGEVIEDCGDERNPPCPVLTPNQWYKHCLDCTNHGTDNGLRACPRCGGAGQNPRQYCCWPPFHHFHNYYTTYGRAWEKPELDGQVVFQNPICLIHNLVGWGYGALVPAIQELGVRCYGAGSPDKLIPHCGVPLFLSNALAYVHLKSSDAPGYALYEALAAGCPVICTRRLIWRCRMQDLLIPGRTCLTFDRETHDALSEEDVRQCRAEVAVHLEFLRDPWRNRWLGMAGLERLFDVMWSKDCPKDVESLRRFFQRNFPN